jgi:hypothetical protein
MRRDQAEEITEKGFNFSLADRTVVSSLLGRRADIMPFG